VPTPDDDGKPLLPNVLLVLAIIGGHLALFALSPWRPADVKQPFAPGDPNTMFSVLFFGYWGAILFGAGRYSDRWPVLQFLAKGSPFFALISSGLVLYALFVYFGLL
jgi:hypothetical protein